MGGPKNHFKVALVGGAGGVGQSLGLLLKLNPLVTELALFDVAKATPGVALDLSHINTWSNAHGFSKKQQLFETLSNATAIVLTGGQARKKPESVLQKLFKVNADMTFDLMKAVVCYAPCAFVVVLGNPINSLVPLVSEFLMKANVYDPRKVFGVTTLDLVRSSKFVATLNRVSAKCQYVPVVGGHDGPTIIPLISQSNPPFMYCNETTMKCITEQVQTAGNTVLNKKAGAGSGTLVCAHAAARFIDSLLKGLTGQGAIECAYVRSDVTSVPYFSTPLVLGRCGLECNLGLGQVNAFERTQIDNALPILQKQINQGVEYIKRKEKYVPLQVF